MILLRTMTVGLTLRNVIPSRSKMPMPAPVMTDWIHSRKKRIMHGEHHQAEDHDGEQHHAA